MQIALTVEKFGKENFKFWTKNLDLGDFIGVSGEIFTTKHGEKSLLVEKITLLGKALLPLPEKWHGLTDQEKCYRERHLDLATNRDTLERFKIRSSLVRELRNFLHDNEFLEVETPVLQTKPSGALAKPFYTHHSALDLPVVLRIAPETYLKRCVLGGLEKVFEFARCFRNEGIDPTHLQDFTMLEFYEAYANFEDLIDLTEKMFAAVLEKTFGKLKFSIRGQEVDFTPPWPRIKLRDAILENGGPDIAQINSLEDLKKSLREKKIALENIGAIKTYGKLVDEIYKKLVRPKIIQPTFLTHHPIELSPLARRNDEDPNVVDRFQLVTAGWELVNAYSELVDPLDQRSRFESQLANRAAGDDEALPLDEEFITALEHGAPPIAGWGCGIDRLVTLLTDQNNVRDTVLFPLMRPE
jgi:lysyl-tRNA synthetase class 2